MKVEISDTHFQALIQTLIETRNFIAQESTVWMTQHPLWDPREDVRISTFWKLHAAIDPLILLLIYDKGVLMREDFWVENFGFNKLLETGGNPYESMRSGVEVFVKIGFIQIYFSILESTFRILLHELDANAAAGATSPFEGISKALLKLTPSVSSDAHELLKIWSVIRNSIHNNGLYVPRPHQSDCEIPYRGNLYPLRSRQPLNWVTWDLLARLLFDSYELIKTVVRDPAVAEIATKIIDPCPASW